MTTLEQIIEKTRTIDPEQCIMTVSELQAINQLADKDIFSAFCILFRYGFYQGLKGVAING